MPPSNFPHEAALPFALRWRTAGARRARQRRVAPALGPARLPVWAASPVGRGPAALLASLALLLLSTPAAGAAPAERWAQLTHTAFKHHASPDTKGGTCFAQDRSGFMWIGTQSGLVRWDGYTTVKFVANPARADALPDSYITSLLVDRQGRLWAGTNAGGLARYDAERDTFTRYPSGPAGPGNGQVSALADDGDGGLWVGTSAGLYHLGANGVVTRDAGRGAGKGAAADASKSATGDAGKGTIAGARSAAADGAGGSGVAGGAGSGAAGSAGGGIAGAAPFGSTDALLRQSDGTLWIGTATGLHKRGRGGATVPVPLPGVRHGVGINALYQDSSGRLWIGTRTHGAFVIEPGADAPAPVREPGARPTLQNERVSSITEAGQGEIWLGTDGADGGILAIDPLRGGARRIRHQADTQDSLSDNEIMALFRERSGIIYVASTATLSQHDPLPRAVTTIRSAGAATTLSAPSVLAHPDGRLWLGVVGGGIDIVDPRLGAVSHLIPAHGAGARSALPQGRVLAMAAGKHGMVYIGTQQGLYRADADGRALRRLAVPRRRIDEPVWTLSLVDGVLWVGGLDGLWALADADGHASLLRHEGASLGDLRVMATLPVDGALWVGTRSGLARVVYGGGVEVVPTALAGADRLPPGYASSLLVDRRRRLWVSLFGTGIVILERTDADGRRRFRRLGIEQGLPDTGVNQLLADADGVVWASTDAGLARIDPATLAVRALGPADGVHVATYWTGSGARTAEGELAFGGLTGLTVLRPRELPAWDYRPPVVVSRIVLNDVALPAGRYNAGRAATDAAAAARPAAPVAPIEITPAGRGRGFSLEFAALDYSAPERNQYAYRLAGFDGAWIKSDAATRRASYTNLPPGDYRLQLRGSNRNGDWSAPLEVPVRVLAAWHQTAAARGAGALLALAALAALVRTRTALLRRRQRELQAMVEARTAELRATQARLEQLAYGDALTGLANRRLFNDELRHLVARTARDGAGFTLLLIDLDRFKQINDTLGHDAGDALLAAVATRLAAALREAERPFRLGGDEFAVLLGGTSERGALEPVCQRILRDLAAPVAHGAAVIRVSASVGAAIHTGPDDGHEELYKRADLALYRAKAAGRDTWRLAGDD